MKDIILESLNKIRELEKPQLNEALSGAELSELQALQKELSGFSSDPDVSAALALYSKIGAATTSSGQAAQPAATKKPAAQVDPKAAENAKKLKLDSPQAIMSYQKAKGLQPDGIIGPKTADAMAQDVAKFSPGQSTPDQSSAETQRLAAQAGAGQAAQAAGDPMAVLAKAVPNPKPFEEYWVNGNRYKWTTQGGKPQWVKNFSPGDWGFNKNQAKASAKYTGPDSGEVAKAADAAKPATGQAAQPAQNDIY